MVQRPATGLLAGLWEFPEIENTSAHTYAGQVTHTFTHKRITYRVFTTHKRVRVRVRVRERPLWLSAAKLNDLALPTAQRNVWKLALPSFGL